MSYAKALERLRQQAIPPPRFSEVQARQRWTAARTLPRPRALMALTAIALAIGGYVALTLRPVLLPTDLERMIHSPGEAWRSSLATLVPALLLSWAVTLVRRQELGAQMLVRAIAWSNLVVGTLVAGNFTTAFDRLVGSGIAVACAVALLAMGGRGLDDPGPRDPFQPVRFRGLLLLALVMAFADAQTLVFSAGMQLRLGMHGWTLAGTIAYAGPAAIAAAVMVLAVWGLYHLRTWALLLNLLANFAIATLALGGTLHVAGPVALTLAGTATVQAFLPVPILALALGDRHAGQPLLRGHAAKLLPASVVAIAALAVGLGLSVDRGSGWLTGPANAFARGLSHLSQHEHEHDRAHGHDRAHSHDPAHSHDRAHGHDPAH